ncbi:DoxX family protein [Euzebya tangerina]|uniref:DoxX family protein n=1 Tax=Euzebya tangerina TaxID=591198 RepID=UPI000E30DD89|nr:DoxX family protein [Euzebya tangerina]
MSVALWVLQGLLAAAFLAAGAMKAFTPEEKLLANDNMAWIETEGMQRARTAGYAEIAGALGLILPGVTGIATFLTPLAALGLAITMVLAMQVHQKRNEPIVPPAVLGVLCLIVLIGRVIEPL